MNLNPTPEQLQAAERDFAANREAEMLYRSKVRPTDTPAHWKVQALAALDYAIDNARWEVEEPEFGFTLRGAVEDGRITTTGILWKLRRQNGR